MSRLLSFIRNTIHIKRVYYIIIIINEMRWPVLYVSVYIFFVVWYFAICMSAGVQKKVTSDASISFIYSYLCILG